MIMRLARRQPPVRRRTRAFFGVVRHGQAYLNLLYLIINFPLGLAYTVGLVALVAVGVGTAVIGVGLLALAASLVIINALGAFERDLTIWWLNIAIPWRPVPTAGQRGFSRWWALARDGLTWRRLAYLLIKCYLGALIFALITAVASALGVLIASPLQSIVAAGATGNAALVAGAAARNLPLIAIGALLGVLLLHLGNGIALLWGYLARALLGRDDVAARLALAQSQAASARTLAATAQAQAAQAEQSRRELIVNVGHELRTPIATILGHVETLQMNAATPLTAPDAPHALERHELERRYLAIIARETARLGTLVDDLLALARAESGELHLAIGPVAAGDVLEEVYQSLAPLALRDRRVTLTRAVPAGLPNVLADRQRLTQVTLNLARNAITYTPEGGIVALTLEVAGPGQVALVVADTGIGIAPEDLDHVFDRFFRADTSRSRSSGGFGLGLAIVRDLAQAMGGAVIARSVPGQGSVFTVLLRVA